MASLDQIRTFVTVVKQNSFARAGRVLGVTPSVVSKRIAELEHDLGVQLLLRTTRKLTLSDHGARYFHRAVELLQRFDELERDIARHRDETAGLVRIGAPTSIGVNYIGPALIEFRARHPDVRFDLVLHDRTVDPVEEGLDLLIAEQTYVIPNGDLTEEPLCPIERVICASPAYLARRGTPQHPRDLVRHDCLHYSFLPSAQVWLFTGPTGEISVPVSPVFSTSNGQIMRQIALKDGGLAMLPTHVVGEDIRAGRLAVVLTGYELPQFWLVAILPPLSRISRRVQLLVEHLRAVFSPPPWLRGGASAQSAPAPPDRKAPRRRASG